MNKSNELIVLLEKFSQLLHNESATSDEINEIKTNINHLKNDSRDLEKVSSTIANNAIDTNKLFDEIVAYFNIYFGDIIQELENIQEIIDNVNNRK